MKRIFTGMLLGLVVHLSFGQEANTSLVSFTGKQKMDIARSSIEVPSWHEKSFWPLYEKYVVTAEEIALRNTRLRSSLASLDKGISTEDAKTIAQDLLASDREALATKKLYHQKVGEELNGIISLQFLQSEILMDIMESSKVYESSPLKKYRFHPGIISDEQYKKAKHKTIENALGLSGNNDYFFWNIYSKYEEEVDNVLGKDYSLIAYYAGDPSDFTPALAKRIGQDLISVMEREQKLKEKYYAQLNETMGPVMAAKFLAWEDYYSLTSKMHAWAEAQ